jgi:hypothetical protein
MQLDIESKRGNIMKTNRNIIFGLAIIFALLTLLVSPTLVYADGETEPPSPTDAAVEPPPPTEEPATEVVPAESVATESPVAPEADVAPIDDPNASTDTAATESPAALEANTVPVDDPNASTTDAATTEEPTVSEIIQGLPAGTDVVVLNETGEILPLATQEAADIIAMSDPMWCPAAATQVTSDCESSATVAGLIGLISLSKDEDGIIYFTSTYNKDDATFDGSNPHLLVGDNKLTLQGGWNGNITLGKAITYSGQSVFSVPITITNWGNDITVNNITVSGAGGGNGLEVTNSQDVTIADSTFEYIDGDGVDMYGVGAVTINNSLFRGNNENGLNLGLSKSVTIANSTFTGNGWDGANIYNTSNATIADSKFSQNGKFADGSGATVSSANRATITGNAFDENGGNGAKLYNIDSASISKNTFNGNGGAGLAIDSPSYTLATIEENTFKQNGTGIDLFAEPGGSVGIPGKINATLKCNTFQGNGTDMSLSGYVTVTDESCGNPSPPPLPPAPNFVTLVIDCSLNNSFLVQWVSGDQVLLSCVDGGTARISRVDNTTLPRDMPSGLEYASGFLIEIFQNGVPLTVLPDGGFIQFGFASRHANPQYGIMYWDEENGNWIQLKDFQIDTVGAPVSFSLHSSNQQDEFRILSGAHYILDGNRYLEEVTTNFPGIFILAQH